MTKNAPRLPFGQPVEVCAELVREDTTWVRHEITPPMRGLVIGYRTRNDGHHDTDRDEWSGRTVRYYVPLRGFRAALVAFDLSRLPMIVLDADMRAISASDPEDSTNG